MTDLPVYINPTVTMAAFRFARGLGDILKTVEDLDRYEHVIEQTKPDVIVECGTRSGASARWFASKGIDVVTIDVNVCPNPWDSAERITPIIGDTVDPLTVSTVAELVDGRRVMVSLDSAHTRDHVRREIRCYGEMVTPGCYLVVEDGIFRFATDVQWRRHNFGDPRQGNPLDAIEDTLVDNPKWMRDIDVEMMHQISHHPAGWWVRL